MNAACGAVLVDVMRAPSVTGTPLCDVRIAAFGLRDGLGELWAGERTFSYLPPLRTRNPVVAWLLAVFNP